MYYSEFFRRFGGSARTKNVCSPSRLPIGRNGRNRNKTVFLLPITSELPEEFIRLCPWEMEYVFAHARRATRGILEIGRFNGGSTFMMSCANDSVPITSLDIAPQDDAKLIALCKASEVGKNIKLVVGDSQHTKYPEFGHFDLIFIDGDHSYEGCLADIRNWFDNLLPKGHLLFHDCYLRTSKNGVQDAVLDFLSERDDFEIVVSPYIGAAYWRYPQGSLACLRRR